jgi:hypothetical protein
MGWIEYDGRASYEEEMIPVLAGGTLPFYMTKRKHDSLPEYGSEIRSAKTGKVAKSKLSSFHE